MKNVGRHYLCCLKILQNFTYLWHTRQKLMIFIYVQNINKDLKFSYKQRQAPTTYLCCQKQKNTVDLKHKLVPVFDKPVANILFILTFITIIEHEAL